MKTAEKQLDKIISFNKKEIIKMRKKGEKKKEMQSYQSLEIAQELKRNLNNLNL